LSSGKSAGSTSFFISDISCSTITGITNGGTIAHAFGTQQDNTFPNYDTPINISIFPTPFYLDVNNDGIKDLLASPNTSVGSENRLSSWYYKNTGTTDNPNFKKYGIIHRKIYIF
jgi:hypothetical protein